MPVITISRQFGAGGASVAQIVAERVGAELVDEALVAEVARRLELPMAEVEHADERPETFTDRLLGALRHLAPGMALPWRPPLSDEAVDPRWAIVNLTQELIKEAARVGHVVVVGRGGAFVLRERPNALHVFLHAADEVRTEAVMTRFMLTETSARRRMREIDAARATYIRQLYGADWQDSAHYHLVLDTGRLGHGRAADVILAALGRHPRRAAAGA